MQQKQRKANKKTGHLRSFVALRPTLLPYTCVPGASLTMEFLPGPSTDGIPFALLQSRFLVCFPSGSLLSSLWNTLGVRGYPFPEYFYSCGAYPKVLKVAL